MTNKAYERAFNIAIKYGFCFDCRCVFDKRHCHECDCYENTVKVIRDALEKLDAIEASEATVWHDAQTDPPTESGEYLCYYEYFRYSDYNCMYRTMDRGQFFNGQWVVSLRTVLLQKSLHGQNCQHRQLRSDIYDS